MTRRRRTRLSDEQISDLRERYSRGEPIRLLASSFEIGATTVYRRLRVAGIPTKRNPKKLTEDQIQEIVVRWKAGERSADLARAFNVEPPTVDYHVYRMIGERRPRLSQTGWEELFHRYRMGESTASLAKTFGIGQTTLYRHLHNAGIPTQRQRKLTDAQIEEIVRRWKSGERGADLVKEFGVTSATINNHVYRRTEARRKRISSDDVQEILLRYGEGETCVEIARTYGVHPSLIIHHIEKVTGTKPGLFRRKPQVTPPVSQIERARLATWIDSEGSICKKRERSRRGYRWHVCVVNTSQPLKGWIRRFGGQINERGMSNPKSTKPIWQWAVGAQLDVYLILKAVEPYLIEKRSNAVEAIVDIESWCPDLIEKTA